MTPERFARLRATLERRQPDLTVLLDNVHKPHNFAAILRTCDAVGVFGTHAVWPSARLRPGHHTSGGTARWVGVRTHRSLERAAEHLHGEGFRIYAAHLSDRAVDFRSVDYTRPCAVLLGAELQGVSEAGAALADAHVVIPMQGLGVSLNVSVAAAVILYEAQRQRAAAGCYEAPRLAPDRLRRTLFEWAHPTVAAQCRARGLDYPPLADDGAILGDWRAPGTP